jgi:hypothetical protein
MAETALSQINEAFETIRDGGNPMLLNQTRYRQQCRFSVVQIARDSRNNGRNTAGADVRRQAHMQSSGKPHRSRMVCSLALLLKAQCGRYRRPRASG